jgi:dTDP-glucose 4,6-dehydratase
VKLLVTGGAGFIGSNFVRHALARWPDCRITVLDALTYAGNTANLAAVRERPGFEFVRGNICDQSAVREAMSGCTHVLNFAAETHVDRSILDAASFVRTDVEGTRVLLEEARRRGIERYLQVSTDEVYGDVEPPNRSREDDPLRPRSPYSASKAGGDLMVSAYQATHDLPVLITRGSNTYGPYQYPEKLIPLFVTNALDGQPLPVYGDGRQMRDWLYVADHCSAIATILEAGGPGEIYNIAAENERPNLEVVESIVGLTGCPPSLVRHVEDRPGHDRRYALDAAKLRSLGWRPTVPFEQGIAETVQWYRQHRDWWEAIKDDRYREYYQAQYGSRLAGNAG